MIQNIIKFKSIHIKINKFYINNGKYINYSKIKPF